MIVDVNNMYAWDWWVCGGDGAEGLGRGGRVGVSERIFKGKMG
jgi:hypothetical protein